MNAYDWIKKAVKLGAGEILLTSVDKEGTRKGFDVELMNMASKTTDVPIIASGGFGKVDHLAEVINFGQVDAIAIADAIHYKRISVSDLKKSIFKITN